MASTSVSDDTTLLISWRSGDDSAGNELFRRYFRPLYRFFTSKLEADAEDLVQETLLACVKGEHRLGDDSSFRGYMYGIAWNLLRETLRRKHRRPELDLSVERIADLTPTPSSILHRGDRQRRLLAALRNLRGEDQVIVELYYWEGLRSREIAAAVGIPAPTARSRIRRATDRLRAELDRLEAERGESQAAGQPRGSLSEEALAESFRELSGALEPVARKKS